mgnify:CR=1 FL=1
MAPILSDSGLFHIGLPTWAEEMALTDPYIARLKEESYLDGVGYILEFFNEMIAGGACQDALLKGKMNEQEAEFQHMLYGSDEELMARAMEEYLAHNRTGIVPAPEAMLRKAPDVFEVENSIVWRPTPDDIVIAMEAKQAEELHSDILTDDSARTDDFGQESAHIDGEMDAISELLAWAGKTEMKQRAPLASVLATIEHRWASFSPKQRKFITRIIGETTVTETIEKRRKGNQMVEVPVIYRKISSLYERSNSADMQMLIDGATDLWEDQEAANDNEAHPVGETDPKVQIALDNQARMVEWVAKAALPQEATETKKAKPAKKWLGRPSYIAVLSYAMENGARNPRIAHNRAYAANTLSFPDRIVGYDAMLGFRVILNQTKHQDGLVPLADARVAYPHLPAAAKARISELVKQQ